MVKRKYYQYAPCLYTSLIATLLKLAAQYRPLKKTISYVDGPVWEQICAKNMVPIAIVTRFKFAPPGLCLQVDEEHDKMATRLLCAHLPQDLVKFTILDFLDDTTDRCGHCVTRCVPKTQVILCTYCTLPYHSECVKYSPDEKKFVCEDCV
jgi:hypothetical protein